MLVCLVMWGVVRRRFGRLTGNRRCPTKEPCATSCGPTRKRSRGEYFHELIADEDFRGRIRTVGCSGPFLDGGGACALCYDLT